MNSGISRSWMRLVWVLALVSTMAVGVVGQASAASIIYVKYNATGANNGTSWANAYKSLQTALSHASSGKQIWVAKGTYKPTTTADRGQSFILKSGVAMYGGFAGTETSLSQRKISLNVTILSGDIGTVGDASDNSYHVVFATALSAATLLDGFTVTGGNADQLVTPNWWGGGIYVFTTNLTLRNLIIQNNSAVASGGGIADETGSNPSLTNVKLIGNNSYYGGGMYNANANPTLANVTFSGNWSIYGGGMSDTNSSPVLTKVTFSKNWAASGGGGVYDEGNSNPTLTNVTFKGNYTTLTDGGGGMYNKSSSPKLTNVTFSANSSIQGGGGMENTAASSPTLNHVTFSKNKAASNGGGMHNAGSSNPKLTNVTFTSNTASSGNGGGIDNESSNPTLTNVALGGNTAGASGGGIYNLSSSPKLTNITFSGNSAGNGGGMNNYQSSPTLKNATFSGNKATGSGGGMYNDTSNPGLTNVTFSGNTASSGGDGIYDATGGGPSIRDSIFWGDGSVEIYNVSPTSTIADSIVAGGCPAASTCSGNVFNLDPKLGSLQSNGGFTKTMALGLGSAAIDAGNNTTCVKKDQRGVSRPQGPACDMGAYEVKVMSFSSQGVSDGWVLESSENSSVGGSLNSTATTIRVGDDASNRQYRSVLSFNTAGLPDAATIVRGEIKAKSQGLTGANPFGLLGSLTMDVKKPYFGGSSALELTDFQAPSTASSAGGIGALMVSGWFWGVLSAPGDAAVNKAGTTQIRLRFTLDDNNDHKANYVSMYSGNAGSASQPRLIVYYNP